MKTVSQRSNIEYYKKEIILNEEINSKIVIEEYLEEKSKKFDWKKD